MANQDTTVRASRELRDNLSAYVRQARGGTSIHITYRDTVVAELRPPPAVLSRPRRLGALRGKIRMAPDFDETPADLIDAMEGDD